jgi:uncharacterized protein with HEPN domain
MQDLTLSPCAIFDDIQSAHPEVPWHLMRAMRNRLGHASCSVDPQSV